MYVEMYKGLQFIKEKIHQQTALNSPMWKRNLCSHSSLTERGRFKKKLGKYSGKIHEAELNTKYH